MNLRVAPPRTAPHREDRWNPSSHFPSVFRNAILAAVRQRLLLVSLCGVMLLLPILPACGDAPPDGPGRNGPFSVSYHQENDGPWVNPINGSDRYYTHGLAVSLTHQPEWASELVRVLPFGDSTASAGIGYLFAHEMYTPENLSESKPIRDDRPYAGYAYLGVAHYRAGRYTLDRIQFDIGVRGPITQAGEIQSYVHENWGGRDPQGWQNQLPNEATLQIEIERRWRLGVGRRFALQLLPELGVSLGSLRSDARLGGTLRLGFNLPDDFGPPRFGSPREATAKPRPGLGFYGLVHAGARAVGYDRLTNSGEVDSGSGRRIEHVGGQVSVGGGVVLRVRSWNVEAQYAQILVSPQFQAQTSPHRYGSAFFAIVGPNGRN